MMIRTSLSPSDVTPAAYLLPSAMSLSSRAATRGSTTPIRIAVAGARSGDCPPASSSTASPGFTWASLRGFGEVREEGEAGLAGLFDEDQTGALRAHLRRHRLLAGVDEQDAEPIDVPLGDPVRRVERERGLVVLPSLAELALLPERLREAVLGLRVRPELEQALGSSPPPPATGRPSPGRSPGRRAGASWRVWLTALDGWDSTSGKVTRRSSFPGAAGPRARAREDAARSRGGAPLSSTDRSGRQTAATDAGTAPIRS